MSDLSNPILRLTITLATAIAAGRLVTVAGAVPGTGGAALGPVYTAAGKGESVAVTVLGVATAVAGDAIAGGTLVMAGGAGKVIPYAPDALRSAVVSGSAAGDVTVTDIAPGDQLISVLRLAASGRNVVSLTDEFSIKADETINNAGGTDTSGGDKLLVQWRPAATARPVGRALSAAAADGDAVALFVYPN